MAETDKPVAAHKTIIDVAHPNHSAPSNTSVPVIVTNRPILRDPMMASDTPTVGKIDSEKPSLSQFTAKTITPPVNDEKTEQTDSVTVAEVVTEPEATVTAPTEDLSMESNQAVSKTPQDKINADLEAQTKHDAELTALVENKDYFLPINSATQQRTKRFVIIGAGVSLLLAIVWVDIALDAGIIRIGGLKALTHIFST